MTFLFYRRTATDDVMPDVPLPPMVSARWWRPARDGLPTHRHHLGKNLAWSAMAMLGLFATRDFAELTLWRGGRMLHRLIVTPRWHRFPFMAPADLQIGDLWTDRASRDQGLARAAVAEVHRVFGRDRQLWYVVDAENAVSVGLIEGCGYRLVGTGRRTRPLGFAAFGRFLLDALIR